MKRFISFSGGVESTAMCLLYGKSATAIFCDTGSEHAKMYERLNYVENMLKVYHNGDFELVRIKLVHLAPDEIKEVAELEEAIQDKRGKFFRIKKDMPKVRQFIEIEKTIYLVTILFIITQIMTKARVAVFFVIVKNTKQ